MPWDEAKCQWGYPAGFTNENARTAVENADFNNAVFVNTSNTGTTKKAFTYYVTQGYRICVVGDVHRANAHSPWNIEGNSYIPGWENWQMQTPAAQVNVIGPKADQGAFPGNNRYPHAVEVPV